jgi:Fe-Mn family superoxide dismutase
MSAIDRRGFLFASSGAAAGNLLVPGPACSAIADPSPFAESGLVTGKPKPLRFKEIPGFLSAAQVAPHHTAHYGGALTALIGIEKKFDDSFAENKPIDPAAFETLQRQKSSRGNSVILHELYFDGLADKANDPGADVRKAIEKRFGTLDKWAADFVASAKAAAGWAVLVIHPVNGRLYNLVSDEHAQGLLWMASPLVVLDTYEHAYYVDYQNKKAEYVEKFLKFLDWSEAARRYRAVVKG